MSDTSFMNRTTSSGLEFEQSGGIYEENKLVLWGLGVIFLCIALLAILGNAVVLYVTHFHKNNGPLGNLDIVIKSLAVADVLLGVIGIPSRLVVSRYEGMHKNIKTTKCNIHFIIWNRNYN